MKRPLIVFPIILFCITLFFALESDSASKKAKAGADKTPKKQEDTGAKPPGDIVYTKPVQGVVFSHKFHVDEKRIQCDKCHPKLFGLKALAAQEKEDFTMEAMYKGKYCGACHDGKTAFAANTQCARCHIGVKGFALSPQLQKAGVHTARGPKEIILVGVGDAAVKFAHDTHTKNFGCKDCHAELFTMKRGGSRVTMNMIYEGKSCGACHNGRTAFSASECTKCHEKVPAPKVDLVYKVADAGNVKFSHARHLKKYSCETCHSNLFVMHQGGSKITMDGMYKGRYCGSCHNGKVSFASTECAKCHDMKGFEKEIRYDGGGAGKVAFSHKFHTGIYGCGECHIKHFNTKKSKGTMKMDDMYAGKLCGACHNGQIASAVTDCAKCHKQ